MALKLGLLFSTTGPYAALGAAARAGAELAARDLAARGRRVEIVARDPAGQPENYERLTEDLLSHQHVRHVIGAITSWSRKDMAPVLERHGGLLWYPCPYEGFECHDHIVYLGASPNHHIVPLVDFLARTGVRRVYLVGSNYVWGWETLRLARELFTRLDAEIVGERYIPLGSSDCAVATAEIAETVPDLVFNSLIGPSNAAFMDALGACGDRVRVASCNQTEADLDRLGGRANGMFSAGSFFEEVAGPQFLVTARKAAPNGRCSAFFATSYTAVQLAAEGAEAAGTDAPRAVFDAVAGRRRDTVLGPVTIDPTTRHASLTPHLARAGDGGFEIVESAAGPVSADPYLTRLPATLTRGKRAPDLKVVR